MTPATCIPCAKDVIPTVFGRCPVCGEEVVFEPRKRARKDSRTKLAVVIVAVIAAIAAVGWTYRETFVNDPAMLGICAFCGAVGILAGVGKLLKWRNLIGSARDLVD